MSEELHTDNRFEMDRQLWHVASEAERSLKAALYTLGHRNTTPQPEEELRRNVRQAATDHRAFVDFVRSEEWEMPPMPDPSQDRLQDELQGNSVVEYYTFLQGWGEIDKLEAHLHFEDLDTDAEPLFIDRYTEWLKRKRPLSEIHHHVGVADADTVLTAVTVLANYSEYARDDFTA